MSWKDRPRKNKIWIVVASVAVTLLAVLLVLNFTLGEKKVTEDIQHLYGVADPQFERSMGVLLGPEIIGGNKAQALINGDQIFPSMLQAIRSAKQTINFETYIYWSEAIGREFADAFAERARAGVKVHVLLDWVGSSKMDESFLKIMEDAGVEVRLYRPLRWYNVGRLNNRTHRKLLVVDGRVGFTGGVGIAGQWTGNAQDPEHWRDSHYRVEGPVVAQMQAVLVDNWIRTTGKVLHGPAYFPPTQTAGASKGQVFSSSPQGGSDSMRLMYLLSLGAAEKTIDLSISYFVPDEMTRRILIDAVRRGVRVRIIVPGDKIDVDVVRRSSRGVWGEMLEAGIQIYEYQPTMYHCKVMIVDGLMVSVGSTNFDDRSFRLNDEANLNIYDAEFARSQITVFEDDLAKSRRVTYVAWRDRPLWEKVHEYAAALLGKFL